MKIIIKFFKNIISLLTYPFRYTKMAFNLMNARKKELQARLKAWDKFKKTHDHLLQQWYARYGFKVKPPISYNREDKAFYWTNRAARRAIQKQARSANKKMVRKRRNLNKGSHLKVVK